MADNTENVKYSFQGDTSSLRKATQDAIGQLNRFESAMHQVASQDGFKASRTSVQGLQRAINSLTTQTNTLTKVLNTTSQSLDNMMPKGAQEVTNITRELAESVKYLESVTSATSGDLQLVTSIIKDLGATMSTVAAQATALGVNLKEVQNVEAQMGRASGSAATAVSGLAKSAEPLTRVLPRIQDAYQLSGKSALESARVFASSESVWRRMQVELTNIGQVATRAWNQFTAPLKTVEQKMQSFKDKAQSVFARIETWFAPFAKALRRTSQESEEASHKFNALALSARNTYNAFNPLSSVTNLLSKAFTSLTGVAIGDWFADAAKQSISYLENLNLFTVAMGDAVEEGIAFVNTMQELYGMDPSNLMRYAGNFYQLATAIEMPDAAATNLSLVLTKASNDIASLFNMDIEQVFENLSSGMQGMSRAVRKYGMDIRTSTLQTEAAALGITAQVENMSEANRMGLRFLTMMKQASNANGDFARTIETPANQLRIFREQMSQLGRAIGNFFIKPLGTAIVYINGFIMALRTILTFIADALELVTGFSNSFDPSGAEEEADAIAGVGGAAGAAAKEMKGLIAPFDELNVLKDNAQGGGGGGGFGSELMDPRIAEAIEQMEYKFEEIEMKANRVRDNILEFLGFKVDMGQIIEWDPSVLADNITKMIPQQISTILQPILEAITALLGTVWKGIQDLWVLHIQPMLEQTGDALSPVLDTIAVLWSYTSQIIKSAINLINNLWISVLQPILGAFFDAIGNIMTIIGTLWAEVLGPVIEYIGAGIYDLWINTLLPIIQRVIEIVGGVIEIVLALWNNVLAPVIDWLIKVLGPSIQNLIKTIWDIVSSLFKSIGGVIDGLLTALEGVIDFLAGVFTGDWERAWKGIVNIFIGLGNAIISAFEFCVNAVIGLINGMISLVYNAVVALINSILGAVSAIAGLLGFDLDLRITAPPPAIPMQRWGRIPELATGGVVTSPTYAMIGEGAYDEAVIPLGDSPQMAALVQKIADAVDKDKPDTPVNVHVYIGDEEFDAYTYKAFERGKKTVGAQPVKMGG